MEDDTLGPTVTDLASEDRALLLLLRALQVGHSSLRNRGGQLSLSIGTTICAFSQERSGLLILLGTNLQMTVGGL